MELGPLFIDTAVAQAFVASRSTLELVLTFISTIGWLGLVYAFLYLMLFFWKEYKEEQYNKNWEWVLLAIDIPPINLQTPKAVELMFSHLAGAYDEPNLAAKFRHGYKQRWFSFEIISLEGYIQFLVRTERAFQDLVEAAIYAQYPEVEITEVEDYVTEVPDLFPNDEYDMWGTDFGLAESFAYPIRSYIEFEPKTPEEQLLKDPMGTFLESFSRIGAGEQMWFQILLEPTGNAWKEKVIKKIKDLAGDIVSLSGGKKKSGVLFGLLGGESGKATGEIRAQIFGGAPAAETVETKEKRLSQLTPGQAKLLEAMEKKITKIGFKTKMRAIYTAKKEVFRPERGVNALIGALNQYNIPSANSIVPTTSVNTNYFLKAARNNQKKTKMMSAYKKRKMKVGGNAFVFNIEELATVWHFPLSHVKTPLLQKTQGKRAEPPTGLPIESIGMNDERNKEPVEADHSRDKQIITDAGDVAYFSADEEYG